MSALLFIVEEKRDRKQSNNYYARARMIKIATISWSVLISTLHRRRPVGGGGGGDDEWDTESEGTRRIKTQL